MKDFTGELVQSFIAGCMLSPKTIKNLVGTLRIMWNSAKAWDYVAHDPFAGIVLPEWSAPEQPVFSREDVQRIIAMPVRGCLQRCHSGGSFGSPLCKRGRI